VTVANTTDAGGGQHVSGVDAGDSIAFDPINPGDVDSLTLRYAGGSAATTGQPRAIVEVRLDAPDGRLVGSGTLNATAGTSVWASQSVAVDAAAGSHKLFLVFRGVDGGPATALANLNWVEFAPASP
jgi:hypothetical protein